MRIVFDTNVILSGFLTVTGISEYIFALGIKRHEVILSDYIVSEIKKKLASKLKFPPAKTLLLVDFLYKHCAVLKVKTNPAIHFKDKKDIPILSLLEAARPDCLITGDKALLSLKKFGTTLILSPREALEIL